MRKFSSLMCAGLVLVLVLSLFGGALAAPDRAEVKVLIGFRQAPGPAEAAAVAAVGGRVEFTYTIVNAIAATLPEAAIAGLLRNPMVTVIEPDVEIFAVGYAAELDNTWGVKRIGAGTVHAGIGGEDGYTGDAMVKVGVFDTGIDYDHPELTQIYAGGWDFVGNGSDPVDRNGHGTHVAGTIAAARDGSGVVGVAPDIELYALKVLSDSGSGNYSYVIAALEWAIENEIKVTNHSYGSRSDPGTLVRQAFDKAYSEGLLQVAAAGNEGNAGGNTDSVIYPAKYQSVIAVAATTSNDTRPAWSSTGPAVEIAAPGASINSTIPGGGYKVYSGTSMASPHAAGVAALVWGKAPELSNEVVRDLLRATAEDLGMRATHQGDGLVRADWAVEAAAGNGLEPPSEDIPDGVVKVSGISHRLIGGKHLRLTVTLEDQDGSRVADAMVTVSLSSESGELEFSGTTSSDGTVTFAYNHAPKGDYTAQVTLVQAAGLTWNEHAPENTYIFTVP